MRLLLEPFRQHKRLELDLPDAGMVQLAGHSGAGKSTILDAVREAISGESDDVIPWGGSKSKVELWLGEIHIKRTRGPHTLTLRCPAGEFKDEAAQAKIVELLGGMDDHALLASSYIRQGLAGSLLSLGAADQLRFVQRLAANAKDPEILRQKIQEMVTRRTANLAAAEREHTAAKEAAQAAQAHLERAVYTEPVPPMDPVELYRLYAESEEVQSRVTALEAKAGKIRGILRDPVYATIRTIDTLKAKNNALIANNTAGIGKLDSELYELTRRHNPGAITAALNRKTALTSKRVRLEVLDQMKVLAAEVAKKYGAGDKPGALLEARAAELKRLTDAGQSEYARLSLAAKELMDKTKPQHCPECSAALVVVRGQIERAQDLPDDHEEQIEKACKARDDYNTQHMAWHAERGEVSSMQGKIALLKGRLVDDAAPDAKTLADIQRLTSIADEAINEQKSIESSIQRISQARLALETKNTSLRDEIVKAERAVAGSTLPPEEEIKAQSAAADAELAAEAERLGTYTQTRAMRNVWINACHARDKAKAVYDERLAALEGRKNDALLKELKVVEANAKLAAAKRLRERSDQAAVMSIELILEEINQNAKIQLDRMFPLDGTTIRIKNVSQNQDGDHKAKFSTEIFHKGQVVKKLASMSGGERSRAYMAFQLALAEMYKSPFLLVDEGFAGLHKDQVKECLELLRESASNRLILVIEHGAPESLFDQVIHINDAGLTENA